MSTDRTVSRPRESRIGVGTYPVVPPQQDWRPVYQYLTEVTRDDQGYCVMLYTLPRGGIVPLHSHADRETFYVTAGNPDIFWRDHWETLGCGSVVDAQNAIQHAWRNSSEGTVSILCITTMRMARFLRDTALDSGFPVSPADGQRFLGLIRENGYWLGSPEDNAAIGLQFH